jgi:hypothetical protein
MGGGGGSKRWGREGGGRGRGRDDLNNIVH